MAPARFVADSSLDWLARPLRFLGFDVLTIRGARLEELYESGKREGRVVLTTSRRHPRKWAAVPALTVRREDPAAALRAIASEHEPAGPTFSRCADCNTALQNRHPFEARGEVPGRVLRTAGALRHCPTCGKWYWEGTHVARIRERLAEALGRPLDRPNAGTPTDSGAT